METNGAENNEASPTPDYELIKRALTEVLDSASPAPITQKYADGILILKPSDPSLQAKEMPIQDFFKKVIRVRDQLRVLEQKINNHPNLSESEKASFQSYLTRSYGALTSFNMLFKEKSDHFVGQKGK